MIEQLNTLAQAWWDWMWPMFWQVGVLIAVVGAIDLLLHKYLWPQVRYALWLLVVVKLMLPPTFALPTGIISRIHPWVGQTFKGPLHSSESSSPLFIGEGFHEENGLPYSDFQASALAEPFPDIEPVEPGGHTAAIGSATAIQSHVQFSRRAILMAVWLAGTLGVGSWSALRLRRLTRVAGRGAGQREVTAALAQPLADAARKLHMRRLPRVVVSPDVRCPAVIGPLRPVVLIPARGIERLSRRETEHIFLHEMAHIKRGDLIIQTLCLMVQVLYWFNPFLWFVQRRLQHLREICCDVTVARILKGEVAAYRQTLMGTAHWLLTKPRDHGVGLLGLVEGRSRLLSRIKSLEHVPLRHGRLRLAATAAVVVFIGACVLPMAQARSIATNVSADSRDARPSGEPTDAAADEGAKTPAISPKDDAEATFFVRISDFGRYIRQLQDILAGELARVESGPPDDKGMPAAVAYFEGASDRPLVFHLEEKQGEAWCVDYFYIGSSDIGTSETIPSHAECPVEQHFVVPRLRTADGSGETLVDSDPVQAVRKQVDHLRALLEYRFTGRYSLSPPGEVMCGFVKLGHWAEDEGSYLAFHLVRQGREHRVDCMETTDSVQGCLWEPPASASTPVTEDRTQGDEIVAYDDFDGRLGLDWDIINPNPAHYALTGKSGALTITTINGHFSKSHTNYENLFLIKPPVADGGDFQMTTCISGFEPAGNWHQAGLVCFDDEDNYVKLVYEYTNYVGGRTFTLGQEIGGQDTYKFHPVASAPPAVWLRIAKRGSVYQCSASTDGEIFRPLGSARWKEGLPECIGLYANNGSTQDQATPSLDASFEFFEVASVSLQPESSPSLPQPPRARTSGYTIPAANLHISQEWQPCAERLRAVYAALKAYEQDKGTLPNWLSDLAPGYLKAEDLIWPEDGPTKAYRTPDPKLPCSFGYQYSSAAPGPGGKTCRQWKDQQRALCGDVVPLVRSYRTDGRCVNLSFAGRVYLSSLVWERDLDSRQGPLYQSALAQPAPPAAVQDGLATRWQEAIAGRDLVCAFRGEYLHRSRGRDYLRATIEKHIAQDGTVFYFSSRPGEDSMLVLGRDGRPRRYDCRYESRNCFVHYDFGAGTLVLERKLPQQEEPETFNRRVGEGALPDFNSRPDPYLIQHVLLQSYDLDKRGEQTFTVYDVDNEGTGVNEYEITLDMVDEDGVTLPNGRFQARHFVQVQRTVSNTWYKKGPGSKTEYWVDDDFTILRVYRHREPYEVILENYGGTVLEAPAPSARRGARFEIPAANLQIPEKLKPCAAHLSSVYAALRQYEKNHGDMPDWLSQLVPTYLEAERLFCPQDSAHTTRYWRDPNLPCSYCYELNPSRLRGPPPLDKTMLHYKNAQRKLFGDVVPIVRCFHHGQVLNLAWDGTVYTSRINFERLFIPDYHHGMLTAGEGAEPTAEGPHTYESDLEAFFGEMDRAYPFFDLKGIRQDWMQTKDRLRQEVESCDSDARFLGIVRDALLCLRDSHMGFREAKAPIPRWPARYCPGISFLPATDGRVVVMACREGLDSELKTGRVVTKIDGKDARGLLEEQAKAVWAEGGLSGPQRARLFAYRLPLRTENQGERHVVTILVDGKERDVELVCDVEAGGWPHWYNRPDNLKQVGSCAYTKRPSGVGYVYLRRVDGSTGPGLREAFSTHPDTNGWIVDLRGNGGGGYDQALHDVLKELPRPLAAIIDAGCTSAGETLARDFVRYADARLFGARTAGSSSAKRLWTFPSGMASLSVPVRSRWRIDGKPIEYNGIEPHTQVEAVPEELQQGLNSEVLRAEQYLLEQGR